MSPAPAANLINAERIAKAYGVRPLLTDVSLGVQAGDRIGVVGRNGDGKTTLLRILAGVEPPDAGRVTHNRGLRWAMVGQHDDLDEAATVGWLVIGDRAEHEWAADSRAREIVIAPARAASTSSARSPGCPVASGAGSRWLRLLLGELDVLLLDEPTNHLDIEGVDWLARHLVGSRQRPRRGHPRPLVPGRGLYDDLGGARRARSTATRAAMRRTCSQGGARPPGARPPRRGGRT